MARHGPFIAADRRMVDTVQGGRGEAGAAQACPWCRRRAVGACGAINWSGGQGSCGERPRSHAAVAHGCGRRRPWRRGSGVQWCLVESRGGRGSRGELGSGVEARGWLRCLLHSGEHHGMATGALLPGWRWLIR